MAIAKKPDAQRALRLIEGGATGDTEPTDAALVEGLGDGEPWARELLFDRYAPLVERTLRRVLGPEWHDELADRIHDVFVEALESLGSLRDAEALGGFLRAIAANTAKKSIRRRKARRWLRFWEPAALPTVVTEDAGAEIREALRRTYAILDRMSADDRLAFVLRYIEGLELTEVANACAVSLSTIKRRLEAIDRRFTTAARRDPVLRSWLDEGGRWPT